MAENTSIEATESDIVNSKVVQNTSQETGKDESKASLHKKLIKHFEGNWLPWLFSIVIIILYFLMSDAKNSIALMDCKMGNMNDQIKELKDKNEKLNTRLQDVEIQNKVQQIRIEDLKNNSFDKKNK